MVALWVRMGYCLHMPGSGFHQIKPMTPTLTLVALIVLITLPIIILFWITESPQQRAKRLRGRGWKFARIGKQINRHPSTARRYCLAA